jgi:hypothetical protein
MTFNLILLATVIVLALILVLIIKASKTSLDELEGESVGHPFIDEDNRELTNITENFKKCTCKTVAEAKGCTKICDTSVQKDVDRKQ